MPRFAAPTRLVSSLWFSCGVAVSLGEAARPCLVSSFCFSSGVALSMGEAQNRSFCCAHVAMSMGKTSRKLRNLAPRKKHHRVQKKWSVMRTLHEKSRKILFRTSPIFNGLLVQKEHLSAGKSRSAETPRQCIGVIDAATRIAWTATARHATIICIYSSELGEQFMPDSIGSKEAAFNIDDLVFNATGQEAYFGFDRQEQSDHRRINGI